MSKHALYIMPRGYRTKHLFRDAKKPKSQRSKKLVRIKDIHTPYAGRRMPGFPATKRVTMRYTDSLVVNIAAGVTANLQYRASSIFNPRVSSGGHQPIGRDQWQIFYNHYMVTNSRISVEMVGTDSNNTPLICGIYLSDDTVIPLQAAEIVEQGLSVWKCASLGSNVSVSSLKLRNSFNAKSFFNIKDPKDNFDRLGAPFINNPTEEAVYNVFAGAMNLLAVVDPINVLITIDYDVILSEPKTLPAS